MKKVLTIKWTIWDIQERAEQNGYKLTDKQASGILESIEHHLDANNGVTWNDLDIETKIYCQEHKIVGDYPEPEEEY